MTPWPDLASLELLVALADHGSLSAAARVCGIAQPNASRAIARLERSCGIALIHRATTGATLTPDGLMVVEWARTTLESARALEAGLDALRTRTQTALRIMASQTVAEHLLPTWISRWQEAEPSPSGVRVAVGNSREVIVASRSGECDLGFIESPDAPRGINSHVVASDELVVVVAPGHAWAGRTDITADDLAVTPLVTREPGSGTREALAQALMPRAVAPPALELTSNTAVRVSASAGTAPAVLSKLAVKDALTSGSLKEVCVADLDLTRGLRAVWAGPRRMANPAASRLLEIAAGHR